MEVRLVVVPRRGNPAKPRLISLKRFLELDRENEVSRSKPKTIDELRIAGNHALRVLGNKSLQRIEHADVLRIRNNLAARGLSAATIGKIIAKLHAAFGRAVDMEMLDRNPFDKVKAPKVQKKRPVSYKPQEIEALIDAATRGWWACRTPKCGATWTDEDTFKCPKCGKSGKNIRQVVPGLWWKCLIQLAYTSGLRKGELLNLTWGNLDLEPGAGVVRVEAKKAGTFTAGGREFPILAWTAKDYENRTIPIPDATVEMLREFRDYQEPPRSLYVFLSLDRLQQIQAFKDAHGGSLNANYALMNNIPRDWRGILSTAQRRLGSTFRATTIHDLRRTYGSIQAQHVAIHDLKVLMGHSSIKTTEEYYLDPSDDLGDRVRGAFDPATGD